MGIMILKTSDEAKLQIVKPAAATRPLAALQVPCLVALVRFAAQRLTQLRQTLSY